VDVEIFCVYAEKCGKIVGKTGEIVNIAHIHISNRRQNIKLIYLTRG
jgi:hypothetical protein